MDEEVLYECRICRDESTSLSGFISPCCCIGSVGHVHKDCLNSWLGNHKGTEKYLKCQDCNCEYRRKESIEQNPRIDFEMTVYSLSLTILGSVILLLLILAAGFSSIICLIILIIIYFILIFAVIDSGNSFGWNYWLIIIVYLTAFWSGRKVRTFMTDIFLILGYAALSFDFVVNHWDSTKRYIKANYLDIHNTSMFDNFTKTYVNGVI